MRIAYALTIGALFVGSAASLALQSPAGAQNAAQPPQNAPHRMAATGPRGAPVSFADLTATLQPAVVNVSTTQKVEVANNAGPRSLEELFRRFQGPNGPRQGPGPGGPQFGQPNGGDDDDGQPATRESQSLGSGFIIDPSGYIVTNNHVISGQGQDTPVDTITVTLADRREYKAKIIGRDRASDLALLKIDAANLPYVNFGDSKAVRVGDWALAIGNPFGLGGTVTAGIVSALHRDLRIGQYDRYIQTDASINQGNSGGPLFDLAGNVIGINTVIFSPTGGNVGLGFSISSEVARPIVEQLRAAGKVRRGYLGVQIQPLNEDVASALGLPKNKGEIVANVEPTGPAARAGLRQGDVITKVAGVAVDEDNSLSFTVANQKIGTSIPLEVVRNGKRQTLTATIAERPSDQQLAGTLSPGGTSDTPGSPSDPGQVAARQSLGITLQPLTPDVRQELKVAADVQGVVIAALNPNSDAAQKGLRRGDVIRSINQVTVATPAAAAAAVENARKAGKATVLVLFQRGTNPALYVGVELMKAEAASGAGR